MTTSNDNRALESGIDAVIEYCNQNNLVLGVDITIIPVHDSYDVKMTKDTHDKHSKNLEEVFNKQYS